MPPHLLDIDVISVLRRMAQLKEISSRRAEEAIEDYLSLYIERLPHHDIAERIWELRDSVSAYDGAYIALAEALDAPLITCDGKLARSRGHAARIELAV